jgi:bis(5'-nucleosyl)-tetraphosphatase (symmetrical)
MSTYAIGDVQGCFEHLKALLHHIQFDPTKDRLWFAGDLVNRGPESLETLRFIQQIPQVVTVLGNHDMHLLALAAGLFPEYKSHTLSEILSAPDQDELIDWLRHQSLLHHDAQHATTLVHAGIYPGWTLTQAQRYANEVEEVLQSDDYRSLLENIYDDTPTRWEEGLTGWDRLRFIINVFTRMRFCTAQYALDFHKKGGIDQRDATWMPWFDAPHRAMQDQAIIFGHWSALQGKSNTESIHPIDGGCVWGNSLIAMRLEDKQCFEVQCK